MIALASTKATEGSHSTDTVGGICDIIMNATNHTATNENNSPGLTLACAGPLSLRSLYCGWIRLKRANSFTKHMGVFSLGFAMLDTGRPQNNSAS